MPASMDGGSEEERKLYQTPGGRYTAADIRANGALPPSEKFKGVFASHNMHPRRGDPICHNMHPRRGDPICPITRTLASPKFAWFVGGKKYLFCCPPCIDEFVRMAKEQPEAILAPERYVRR
jgi:YHS domain-containing protein